ncbi:MAG TPA: hypothetical protein PK941_15230 [Paludibacter sp.]|nr:hypothetical protein [Paludibacter sp.]
MENKTKTVEFTSKSRGFAYAKNTVLTFEIQGVTEREDIRFKEYQAIYSRSVDQET